VLKKILIGVGVIIFLMAVFMVLTALILSSNNKQKGVNEEKMSAQGELVKKALIIYQPGGISSNIAHQIAKGINDGGYEVTLNYPGEKLRYDISEYSIIVFGTPVYAGQPSKALTDYMSSVKDFSSSKVMLYSVGMIENKVELDVMEKNLNGKKANEKVKFLTGSKKENDSVAYELGKRMSKE
jgi:menaquinone-dependent protoporphyrinogen IX oxidase